MVSISSKWKLFFCFSFLIRNIVYTASHVTLTNTTWGRSVPIEGRILNTIPEDRACADFNHGAAVAAMAGLENVFVCPSDGVSRWACRESFPLLNVSQVVQSHFQWDAVALYLLIGPNSAFDAFLWWLPLMRDWVDIIVIADSCPPDSSGNRPADCEDSASRLKAAVRLKSEYEKINIYILRTPPENSGYKILSCKMRWGVAQLYTMFPKKLYYIKIDTDTILFPRRLMNFLHTMYSVTDQLLPTYFGTTIESGMTLLLCGRDWSNVGNVAKGGLCYAQGGGGYGLNNVAMKALATSPNCTNPPDTSPEDTFTAMRMYDIFNITVIHCGGFSSSELVSDMKMRNSISFHFIDAGWLRKYGQNLWNHAHPIEGC